MAILSSYAGAGPGFFTIGSTSNEFAQTFKVTTRGIPKQVKVLCQGIGSTTAKMEITSGALRGTVVASSSTETMPTGSFTLVTFDMSSNTNILELNTTYNLIMMPVTGQPTYKCENPGQYADGIIRFGPSWVSQPYDAEFEISGDIDLPEMKTVRNVTESTQIVTNTIGVTQ